MRRGQGVGGGSTGGRFEREGGTVCGNVDRGGVRGVYVFTGGRRGEERGRGAKVVVVGRCRSNSKYA